MKKKRNGNSKLGIACPYCGGRQSRITGLSHGKEGLNTYRLRLCMGPECKKSYKTYEEPKNNPLWHKTVESFAISKRNGGPK